MSGREKKNAPACGRILCRASRLLQSRQCNPDHRKGCNIIHLTRQGMDTQSCTEAEVIAAVEVMGLMLLTGLFLEHQQGYPAERQYVP